MRPGIATSEFLGVVISLLVSALVFFQLIPAEQAMKFTDSLTQFLNLVIQAISLLAAAYVAVKPLVIYIESRYKLKQQALSQQQSTTVQQTTTVAQNTPLTPQV